MGIVNRRTFLKLSAMLGAIGALEACVPLLPAPSPANAANQAFLKLVSDYVAAYYPFHPIRGPESGFHDQDGQGLDDLSAESLAREVQMVTACQQRLGDISPDGLGPDLAIDHEVFAAHLAARRDELEVSKTFTRDPYFYADIIQMGILYQMLFEYPGTTLDSRLQVVLRQLEDVPSLMKQAVQHLQSVPLELIDYGLSSLSDTQSFLENDVLTVFGGAKLADGSAADALLQEKIDSAVAAIGELIAHLEALRAAPGPKPSFALGEAGLARRLRIKHGIALPEKNPFAQIMDQTQRLIAQDRAAFEEAAQAIDSSRPPLDVWAEVQTHHPLPGQVAEIVQGQVDQMIAFLKQKEIITLPTGEVVAVKAAPAFMLYWYATCWQTGPFEPAPAPPAVYYVSDPAGILEGTDEQNEFLMSMITPELWSTTAHEAYPGHFIQGYALKVVKRRRVDTGQLSMVAVCNVFMPFSYSEGWAHYCEQMVREEGLLQEAAPRDYQEYLMGQLTDSLLRLGRTYIGIQLHLEQMTMAEAADFLEQNAYVTREMAEGEAQRATYEPEVILYALGKMALLQLRADYRAELEAQGKTFSLRQFHDDLLAQGQYPLPVLRRKLLPGDQRDLIR